MGEINSGIRISSSLPLSLYTSVFGCGCGFGFEQKFWRIYGFGKKKARISGFAYPYSPPLYTHFLEENINLISYCPSAPYEHTVHPVQFRRKKSFLPDNNCSEIIHLGREGFLNVSLRKSADLQPRRSNQQPLKVSFSHLG